MERWQPTLLASSWLASLTPPSTPSTASLVSTVPTHINKRYGPSDLIFNDLNSLAVSLIGVPNKAYLPVQASKRSTTPTLTGSPTASPWRPASR